MTAVEAQRTVVKSVPELWAALSDATTLDELLSEPFGEIRIARLEPEAKIDWESDLAHGSVELATSVFGTRMRLTAEIEPPPPPPAPPPAPARRSLLARLLRRRRRGVAPLLAPSPPAAPAPIEPSAAAAALNACLDEVGAARHRPFSRDAGGPAPHL
jgi:hypothetical protein